MVKINEELHSIYEDKDGLLKEELQGMRGNNIFNAFYENLKATREYHNRFPNLPAEGGPKLEDIVVSVQFSGEEVFGKYFDLHSFYMRFCNLPNLQSRDQDYVQYLDKFNSFFFIPENCKSTKAYAKYINDLFDYLSGFFRRVQPLIDLTESLSEWKSAFEEKWNNNKIPGWKSKVANGNHSNGMTSQPLRLGMFNSVEELEALGLDRLKQSLEALGLKCGGTLRDRAERLWSVRGKKPSDFPEKLKAKKSDNASSDVEPGEDLNKKVL